ncbi:MAG: hypothetical protein IJC99_03420 [Clostridia bacterium]|nr:hypothetical protein [Clostridia bacterium]
MMKRIVALALCLVCLLPCFVSCKHGENDKGAYIRMYLSEPVYNVDPLNAFDNQATLQVVSLLYEGLFTADENGKPKKALVDKYKYEVDKDKGTYKLVLELKETAWSDGIALTAYDAQYAFERLFSVATKHPAVGMLYDIKNARKIALGEDSIGHLGVVAVDPQILEIEFERDIDVDAFLPALCSPALYPLRADQVDSKKDTWSDVAIDIVCSGPFKIASMNYEDKDGFVLARNDCYYRNRSKDKIDKYVKPCRIIIDYKTKPADQLKNLNSKDVGAVYYFGYIPLSAREDKIKGLDISDAASTHVFYMNENRAPFDKLEVRQALSLALDREAIAEAIVYAEAATALVPNSIRYRADKKAAFRKKAEDLLDTSVKLEEAKALLKQVGVNGGAFTLTVNATSEEHVAIAEMAKKAWSKLGFDVTVEQLKPQEVYIEDGATKTFQGYDIPYQTKLQSGDFDVISLDLVATAPTAMAYLAPFATEFSGNGYTTQIDAATNAITYTAAPHITGYNSAAYNMIIDEAQRAESEKERAEILVEAEKILMNEMPVIPVIYNQDVSLSGKKLNKVKSNFYTDGVMTKAKLSGYWKIALAEGWVEKKK